MEISKEDLTKELAARFIAHVAERTEDVDSGAAVEHPSTESGAYDRALKRVARRAHGAEDAEGNAKYVIRDANRLYRNIRSTIRDIPTVMIGEDVSDAERRGYEAAHTLACELIDTFHENVSDPGLSVPR